MKMPHRNGLGEKMVCKCVSVYMSIHSLVLYAVSVWVDLSDRKPSRELAALTLLCLDNASKSTPAVVVGGEAGGVDSYFFFPLLPLWDHCIIQETLTEPCTSLYIFGTKLDLPTSHREEIKKNKKSRKTGSQSLKIHSELSVAHPSPSCSN